MVQHLVDLIAVQAVETKALGVGAAGLARPAKSIGGGADGREMFHMLPVVALPAFLAAQVVPLQGGPAGCRVRARVTHLYGPDRNAPGAPRFQLSRCDFWGC